MNRDQFNKKHQHLKIAETELQRKYHAHLREQEEMQRMYEAAINAQRLQSSTAGGGSATNTLPGLYGAASNGLLYSLGNFTNFSFNYDPIPSLVPAVCNGGDGYIYLVVDNSGSVAFASINIATRDIFFYDNDISDFSQKGSGSLYREESGSFIYVDNGSKKSAITNIIRITIDPIQGDADATLVNSIDSNEPGEFLLKQLYLVNGSVWATSLAIDEFELTGPFDIDLGQFTQQPYEINTASKNGEPVNIDWITSCVQNNGIIYIYAVYDSTSAIGLFRFNVEAGYPTWVKDGFFPVEGNTEYIWTLFNI